MPNDTREDTEFMASRTGALAVDTVVGDSISTQFDALIPVDVFGNSPKAAEKAHLLPKARTDAVSWVYPGSAVLGIPWLPDGKVNEPCAIKGILGSKRICDNVVFPGIRN